MLAPEISGGAPTPTPTLTFLRDPEFSKEFLLFMRLILGFDSNEDWGLGLGLSTHSLFVCVCMRPFFFFRFLDLSFL